MPYRFMEHTSDLMIEAKGSTFSEAFESLASGMFSQMGEGNAQERFKLEVKSKSLDVLVVNALSEILAEVEIRGITPSALKVERFDAEKPMLVISVSGEKKPPKNVIKAVTFHELMVTEIHGEWTIRVLFDI